MKNTSKIVLLISLFLLSITLFRCNNNEFEKALFPINPSLKTEVDNKHLITDEESVKYYSNILAVTGEVASPLNLTVDSLKKMTVVTFDSLNIVCQSGAIMNQSKSSRGVLLKDVLNKAGIIQNNHTDRNFYIVARASDGYKATFSWAELFNNPTGEQTYIMFEENNQPVTKKGAMVLNSNHDLKTGPRHVNWLKSIEVYRVD